MFHNEKKNAKDQEKQTSMTRTEEFRIKHERKGDQESGTEEIKPKK